MEQTEVVRDAPFSLAWLRSASACRPQATNEPALRIEKIQSNILAGFNKDIQALLVMRFVVAACASLALLLPAAAARAAQPAAQPDNAALQATLVDLEKQSWEAWKNHDAKFFAGFLSDDHVELGFGGPTGKAGVVAGIAAAACNVKSYAVDHFALSLFDENTALLIYHAAQDTTCGGKAVPSPVWVSSIYSKRGGRWLNVFYQQTRTAK